MPTIEIRKAHHLKELEQLRMRINIAKEALRQIHKMTRGLAVRKLVRQTLKGLELGDA